MARINIEDSLYRDLRFQTLMIKLKSVDTALGALVRAWSVAQKWYLTENKMIPIEEWKKQGLLDDIIECGLGVRIDGFVKMAGADDQFAWLQQRVDAGKNGGLAKAGVRRSPTGSLAPKYAKVGAGKNGGLVPKSTESDSKDRNGLATASGRLATASGRLAVANPLTLTLSLNSKIKNKDTSIQEKQPPRPVVADIDFEGVYKHYPRKVGKSAGMKICRRTVKTVEDLDLLARAIGNYRGYLARESTETRFIKHFSTFMGEWRDWLDSNHGNSENFSKRSSLDDLVLPDYSEGHQ